MSAQNKANISVNNWQLEDLDILSAFEVISTKT